VNFTNKGEHEIDLVDGTTVKGTCINCDDKPCLRYDAKEIATEIIKGLTFNNDTRVCPSNAIVLDDQNEINIKSQMCFACGLCVNRCPIGGIYFDEYSDEIKINKAPGEIFKEIEDGDFLENKRTYGLFVSADKITKVDKITVEFALNFTKVFNKNAATVMDQELVLVRNYMIALGINNKIAAKGNNDQRIDFIGILGSSILPGESELNGSDILGLSRRILEGIAIVHSRHNVAKEDMMPLMFIHNFPSKRSDFYEVITDIFSVTNMKIRTLPIHFLYLLNLFRIKLTFDDFEKNFYIDKENLNFGVYAKQFITDLDKIDDNYNGTLYTFLK
jgi:Fe-S-cluster-containing hydrogenase component 2